MVSHKSPVENDLGSGPVNPSIPVTHPHAVAAIVAHNTVLEQEIVRLRAALRGVHAALDTRDGRRPPWQILDDIETATDHLHNPIGMEDHT
jgi:hypothetical protein